MASQVRSIVSDCLSARVIRSKSRFAAGGAGGKPWQKGASNNKFARGKGQAALGPSRFSKFAGDRKPNIKQEKDDKQQTSTEKVDWNKFKKEKKELKLQRKGKSNKDLFEITSQAKKIYESLKW